MSARETVVKRYDWDRIAMRVENESIREVIIATNPMVEGDTTALYLLNRLKGSGARVSRIALGLPVGGDLEDADRLTLAKALEGRQRVDQDPA